MNNKICEGFLTETCGNCDHWMKKSCPREALGEKPHMNQTCSKFKPDWCAYREFQRKIEWENK